MATEEIKHPVASLVRERIAQFFSLEESEITIKQRGSTFQLYYENWILAYYDGECLNVWNSHPAIAKLSNKKKNEYDSFLLQSFLEISS